MKYKNISSMTLTVGKNKIKPGNVFETTNYINDNNFVRVSDSIKKKPENKPTKDTAKK